MLPPPFNFLRRLPTTLSNEFIETLVSSPAVRIERIVSHGHASPEGFWYDQPQAEFVVLLQGAARLEFEDEPPVELGPGDALTIAAHRRHRVVWTTPEGPTIWLAVHFDEGPESSVQLVEKDAP